MLERSKAEFYADWYRVASEQLIRQIQSTTSGAKEEIASEQDVIDSICLLSICCQEGLGVPTPCSIEHWQADEAPESDEYKIDNHSGYSDIWMNLNIFESYPDELKTYPARISLHEGAYRRLRFDREYILYENINIDPFGPTWFHLDNHGNEIIHAVESYLRRKEVQVKHRIAPPSNSITPFDLSETISELNELDRRLKQWISEPDSKDLRSLVGDQVQRLWTILNGGNIDRLSTNPETRQELIQIWPSIEWAQRWVELGILELENDFIGDYARSIYSPRELDFSNFAISPAPSESSTQTTSRPTVLAEGRNVLVSAHLYDYHVMQENQVPLALNRTAKQLGISSGALSGWFSENFNTHSEYAQLCRRNFEGLQLKLRSLSGDADAFHQSLDSVSEPEEPNGYESYGGSCSYGGDEDEL